MTAQVAPAGAASALVNVAGCNAVIAPVRVNFDSLFFQASTALPRCTDIALFVEGPVRVAPGVPVEYRVRVMNLGPQIAPGIRAGVYLPPGLVGLMVGNGGTYDSSQGWLSWPLFDQIDPGGEQLFSFTLPDPVRGEGYAVVAMRNGDTDYSNNTVAFQLSPAGATPVPALTSLAVALLSLCLEPAWP